MYDLTVSDVARKLGLSEDRVRRLAAAGQLPAVRVGDNGHWRFCEAEVEQALRKAQRPDLADALRDAQQAAGVPEGAG
jgi:excisionase family DNA binding protein